jgi:hypothetical protein
MIERQMESISRSAAPRTLVVALLLTALASCSSNRIGAPELGSPLSAPPAQAAPVPAPGPDYGGLFDGPLGGKIPAESRDAAFSALTAALDAGQRKSWRGEHGLFGYFEPGAASGSCTAFKATTYSSGRPQTVNARACKSPAGDWRAP